MKILLIAIGLGVVFLFPLVVEAGPFDNQLENIQRIPRVPIEVTERIGSEVKPIEARLPFCSTEPANRESIAALNLGYMKRDDLDIGSLTAIGLRKEGSANIGGRLNFWSTDNLQLSFYMSPSKPDYPDLVKVQYRLVNPRDFGDRQPILRGRMNKNSADAFDLALDETQMARLKEHWAKLPEAPHEGNTREGVLFVEVCAEKGDARWEQMFTVDMADRNPPTQSGFGAIGPSWHTIPPDIFEK